MKKSLLLIPFLFGLLELVAQEKSFLRWTFQTNDNILSHPIADDSTVYFGSCDKIFYAVDISTGNQLWNFPTNSPIRSKPLLNENIIYFNAGDHIYSLNKNTGQEIWNFKNNKNTGADQFDYWDYHNGSPTINKSTIFFGLSNGNLNGFDLKTGELKYQFSTIDSAAIRCGLVTENSVIYFADWHGKVYSYNLNTGKNLWVYETYKKKLYDTFGQINTELIIYKDLLILLGGTIRRQKS